MSTATALTTKSKSKSKKAPLNVPTKALASTAITTIEYGGLQAAFDFLNDKLFGDELPEVFIVYSRQAHSRGHYSSNRYCGRVSKLSRPELSLNPDAFIDRTDEQIVSTLVHEMVHHWQYNFGKPSARGYHNKEWAAKMISIGLMPSNTGAVGGKMTGSRVTHYILPDRAFTKAFAELAATGWLLNLQSTIFAGQPKAPPSKIKFTCPKCGSNMWGKPDSQDICGDCNVWRVAAKVDVANGAASEMSGGVDAVA